MNREEAAQFMRDLLAGTLADEEALRLLEDMAARGETAEELSGMATVLREHAVHVEVDLPLLMDTCGTGGSGKLRFNVSTLVAFVLAAAGVPVLKHGNRSSKGLCGSFDLLEAMDLRIDLSAEEVAASLEKTGLGLAFAPKFHPAFGKVKHLRRKLKGRSAFNLLGPLLNPGPVTHHILGVGDPALLELMAKSLQALGMQRALVVHGDGLDEISFTGPTQVCELREGALHHFVLTPQDFGLEPLPFEAICGGDTEQNLKIAMGVLQGYGFPIHRKLVAANAGAGLYLAGKAESIPEGYLAALAILESGAALTQLELLRNSLGTMSL